MRADRRLITAEANFTLLRTAIAKIQREGISEGPRFE
jgi:hypothetical protein